MNTRRPGRWILLVALLVALAALGYVLAPVINEFRDDSATSGANQGPGEVTAVVARVIDGDTIAVEAQAGVLEQNNDNAGEHVVRILGIDTPEMNYGTDLPPECGAQAATERLEELLPAGSEILLQYSGISDRTDRYGRSLTYILGEDPSDIGQTLVMEGLAVPYHPASAPAPERSRDYRELADDALTQNLGSYAECGTFGR